MYICTCTLRVLVHVYSYGEPSHALRTARPAAREAEGEAGRGARARRARAGPRDARHRAPRAPAQRPRVSREIQPAQIAHERRRASIPRLTQLHTLILLTQPLLSVSSILDSHLHELELFDIDTSRHTKRTHCNLSLRCNLITQ